jgi:hypothetical protein
MGEGRQSREGESGVNGSAGIPRRFGAMHVTVHGRDVELYFPPLRTAGSALMLALFGAACGFISGAAISGLLNSGDSAATSALALAFAGVFALPLAGLGVLFMAIAAWAVTNSLTVQVSAAGVHTQRRCFGFSVARRAMPRDDISALDVQLAAKYVGVFGTARYYRMIARSGNHTLLVADTLKGPDMAEYVRKLIIEHLGIPELAAAGNEIPGTAVGSEA